jgi:hypothetical protein
MIRIAEGKLWNAGRQWNVDVDSLNLEAFSRAAHDEIDPLAMWTDT